MNVSYRQMTLRKKLTILFVLFSLAPMSAVAFFNFREASRQLEMITHYQLECLCSDRKAQLQLFFKNLTLNTQVLADHRLIKDMLAEYASSFTQSGTQGELFKAADSKYRKRLSDINDKHGFEDILLVNTAGDVVVSVARGNEWGTNLARGTYSHSNLARCYKKSIAYTELVDFEYYPPIGRPAAFIGSPIVSHVERGEYKEGDLMGVLLVRIPLDKINEIVQRESGLGDSGEVYLMGIDRTTRSALRHSLSKGILSPLDGVQPIHEAFDGDSGYLREVPDYRSTLVSISYAPASIPGLNWIIFAKKDSAEILKPANALKKQSLVIGSVVGALSVAICLLIIHGIITPLKRMRLAANQIASGDLSTRIKIESHGHLGRLAEAFNQMTESLLQSRAQLEEYSRGLEQMVEERTAELQLKTRDLEETNHVLEAYTEILSTLNAEHDLDALLVRITTRIAERTNALLGIMYLYDEQKRALTPLATYGIAKEALSEGFELGSGIPGQAASDGKTVLITDVPESYFKVSSGSIEGAPGSIFCIPIFYRDRLVGMMELCRIGVFTEADKQLLNMIVAQLGIGINNGLALKAVKEMSEELKNNYEILAVQNEELQSQNEEIQTQAEELQSQAEELTAQQHALEEKTRMAAEANRLKSEFVSNISHELRTPLNAILGMTRLLTGGAAGEANPRQLEFLEVIERNGRNLLLLINDILDLSRIESGRTEITLSEIPLKGFVLDVASAARSLIDEKGLLLSVKIPDDLYMHSDADKLRQILTNLLGNAVKFTERGSITISAGVEKEDGEDFVTISVADSGIGIPQKALKFIFDPFRQVDGSITRRFGGTGLGLHISRKLVEMLEGKIEVASTPGKGSVFTLRVPLDARRLTSTEQNWQRKVKDLLFAHIEAEPQPEQRAPERESGTGRDILLIDDDPIIGRELRMILEEGGRYRLRIAFGGIEGLKQISNRRPDLVLLDLNMPDMNGFIVLERLAADLAEGVPVVVLTAQDLTESERIKLSQNVQAVVIKGQVDRQTLLRTIDEVLEPGAAQVQQPALPCGSDTLFEAAFALGAPSKILIVEDAPDNMIFLTEALRPSGYVLCTAGDGMLAVEMAEREKPDLILMDIHIPVLSGYEAMRKIKDNPKLKHIPIIALTARAMKGDRERITSAGFDDYLSKPVHPDDLVEKVRSWLQDIQNRGAGLSGEIA